MVQLFLTVFRMGQTAGYLILAVIIARLLLKKAPKNMICMLWLAVGLRLLCPFHIETAFGLLPQQTDSFVEQMYESLPAAVPEEHTQQGHVVPKTNAVLTADAAPSVERKNFGAGILTAAAWIWFAGMILMSAYLVYSWHHIKIRVAEAVPAESEGIRFYQCGHISSPFLFGLVFPKIYVPFSISGQELSYVLKHEHTHDRRRDYLTKLIGWLLLSVYWFQPFVWAAYLLFCRDIELACDERVIREIGEDCKKAYSQALLTCSVSRRTAVACPVAFGEIGVKKRVKHILNYKKPGRFMISAAALVCLIVTICFATEAQSRSVLQAESEHTQSIRASQDVLNSITRWMQAFCGRDAKTVYEMLDDAGRKQLFDADLLDGDRSFGWSSPWPWDAGLIDEKSNYRLIAADDHSATILYYAWTSDPHVTVWSQVLAYRYDTETNEIVIHDAAFEILDSIHTAKQFFTAYPDGEVNGTRMDYVHGNEAGEALSMHPDRVLSQPDTAARYLLNVAEDPLAVKTEVSEQNGETIVTFTFLEDGTSVRVKMLQLSAESGVWVPQTAD